MWSVGVYVWSVGVDVCISIFDVCQCECLYFSSYLAHCERNVAGGGKFY